MVGEVLGGAGSLFVPVFYLWCKLRTNLFSSLQISATDHVNRVPGCSPCRGETSSGKGGGNYFKAFYCLCVLFQGCCLNCACVLKLVLTYRMEAPSERNCRWDKSGCFILVWVGFFFPHNTKLSLYDLLFHHPWIYSSLELVWWWHFFFSAYWKLWVVPVGQPHGLMRIHPSGLLNVELATLLCQVPFKEVQREPFLFLWVHLTWEVQLLLWAELEPNCKRSAACWMCTAHSHSSETAV